jgi:hypothetical protein
MKTYQAATITILVLAILISLGLYFTKYRTSEAPSGEPTDMGTSTDKSNLIRVTSPQPGSTVNNPIKISGEARGQWFFEASFPVYLTDWDGKIIAQGIATAKGDWMTTEFVPFTAELSYSLDEISGGYSNRGILILKKDNPSGLPEHDDALEMTVYLH